MSGQLPKQFYKNEKLNFGKKSMKGPYIFIFLPRNQNWNIRSITEIYLSSFAKIDGPVIFLLYELGC